MTVLERLGKIDRRAIYLMLTLAVIVPLVFTVDVRTHVDRSTLGLFDAIEKIEPNNKAVMISFDYSPDMAAELDPMAVAVLRHCFARNVRVIIMSMYIQGAALAERAIAQTAAEFSKKAGVDYVTMGFRPGGAVIMMNVGENIRKAFPADYYGVPFDSLPMMRTIRNYQDIPVVLTLASGGVVGSWVIYAGTRYKANIASGVTAVMAPDYYPFLQTGQLIGQLSGMKGAAEYEQLIVDRGYFPRKDLASRAMNAISASHILLIVFIIVGNIAYFASARSAKKPQ
jgi:hypothetical protein